MNQPDKTDKNYDTHWIITPLSDRLHDAHVPSKPVEAEMLVTYIQAMPSSNLSHDTSYPEYSIHVFQQSLQANARTSD